jgi:formylglycine-generating enzyme required for sulfatase activity/tRNA A-37 threonylcarbamoyl transferase component Bud32
MTLGNEPPRAADLLQLEPGAELGGRLVIGALLGSGGMGRVYAARDQLKNQEIALKLLRRDVAANSYARERFLIEARICCDLSHDNIVRVYDVAQSGQHIYMTMERLYGQSLREILNRCKNERQLLPLPEVDHIAHQLIAALRYAHRRQVVHRDIKPENIWVCQGPERMVKLMDFGIARALSHTDLTHTGMVMGTAYYVAPEQWASAKAADWRADQYSLGVVLYELLTGFLPMGNAQAIEDVRPDVPKRYARALMRAISQKPDHRWPSLDALVAELQLTHREFPTFAVASIILIIAAVSGVAVYFGANRPRFSQSEIDASAVVTVSHQNAAPPATEVLSGVDDEALALAPDVADAAQQAAPAAAEPDSRPAAPVSGKPVATPPLAALPVTDAKVGPVLADVPSPVELREPAPEPPKPSVPLVDALTTFQDELRDGGVGPAMVVIPDGKFQMGSPPSEFGHEPDEAPLHWVSIRPFALARVEVTLGDYDRYLMDIKRRPLGPKDGSKRERPVVSVSWMDATAYAKWLSAQTGKSYRLPSEAEWEYAARAGSPTELPFSTGTCISLAQANFDPEERYAGCSRKGKPWQRTREVGSYAQNPFKLYDMHGNVWEWVQDCYHNSYDSAPDDGSAWLTPSDGDCTRRVLRGGSFRFGPRFLRSAERTDPSADAEEDHIGFRLARDL